MANGTDTRARSKVQETPLMLAAYAGNHEIANMIPQSRKIIHWDSLEYIKMTNLWGETADPNALSLHGQNTLHIAISSRNVLLVEILLGDQSFGVTIGVNVKDLNGQTPLHLTTCMDKAHIASLHLDKANPNPMNRTGLTAIQLANSCASEDVRNVRVLCCPPPLSFIPPCNVLNPPKGGCGCQSSKHMSHSPLLKFTPSHCRYNRFSAPSPCKSGIFAHLTRTHFFPSSPPPPTNTTN